MFAGDFVPRDWAFCDGRLLFIDNNKALFAIIGSRYGGDGRSDFRLPDLRGRVPVGQGYGPGLTGIEHGQRGGAETGAGTGTTTYTLAADNLPPHTHEVQGDVKVGVADQLGATAFAPNNVLAKQALDKHAQPTPTTIEGYVSTSYATFNDKSKLGAVSHNIEVQPTGMGKPVSANVLVEDVSTMQPYLGISFIICLNGIFPPRD